MNNIDTEPQPHKLIVLELFSGTKTISKTFEKAGHKVFTIDNNKDLNPDLCKSILDLEVKDLPKEFRKPDIIWASPPCNSFSVLTIGRYWKRPNYPKHHRAFIGMAMVMKTLELIKEMNPRYWFIENPMGMLRKTYFMENLPRKLVTYCKYGKEWRKPTDIFTNANHWIAKSCNANDSCHEKVHRGESKGIQGKNPDLAMLPNWNGEASVLRAEIPEGLAKEIVKVCENKTKEVQKALEW